VQAAASEIDHTARGRERASIPADRRQLKKPRQRQERDEAYRYNYQNGQQATVEI